MNEYPLTGESVWYIHTLTPPGDITAPAFLTMFHGCVLKNEFDDAGSAVRLRSFCGRVTTRPFTRVHRTPREAVLAWVEREGRYTSIPDGLHRDALLRSLDALVQEYVTPQADRTSDDEAVEVSE